MPLKSGIFTRMEAEFVENFAGSGHREQAAWKAGYSQPGTAASKLLSREPVRQAVAARVAEKLDSLVVTTLDRFAMIMANPKTPNKDVAAIGKAVLTHWRGQNATDGSMKDASDMTPAEIQAEIARLQAERAEQLAQANTIEGEVIEAETVSGGSLLD